MANVKVLFLFHMHQPYYLDLEKKEAILPWVRLHGVRSYYDIPYLIDKLEGTRITINLVPSLVEQINLYCEGNLTDIYLKLTEKDPSLMNDEERLFLIDNFFSVNFKNYIERWPNYRRLFNLRGESDDKDELRKRLVFFKDSDLRDLQALFNLAYFGFAAREEFPEINVLIEKQEGYSAKEIKRIVELQFEILGRLIPLYRKLFLEGKIDISVSPYFHPILPLIIDTNIAKVSLPDKPLPPRFSKKHHAYWHIEDAIKLFESVFHKKPSGMWPSEGSVSDDALNLIYNSGIKWIATDEGILKRSGFEKRHRMEYLYRPYIFKDRLFCFFRDRELSDRIGFVYYNMEPKQAVSDFLQTLKRISEYSSNKTMFVPIVFDGENPWEFYDNCGKDFLQVLFDAIQRCDFAEISLFSLELKEEHSGKLDRVWPGSWINASFAIWIGHEEMNTAWLYLKKVADFFESFDPSTVDKENYEMARKELMIAEGSDWFWWYGDDFRVKGQEMFDVLFLKHLSNVYRFLGESPPFFLLTPIKKKNKSNVVLPQNLVYPLIEGRFSDFFEWRGAGLYIPEPIGGAMYGGEAEVKRVCFGQDFENVYFLIEMRQDVGSVLIYFQDKNFFRLRLPFKKGRYKIPLELSDEKGFFPIEETATVAFDQVYEIEIKGDTFHLSNYDTLKFFIEVEGERRLRFPEMGVVETGICFPPFKRLLIEF